MEYNGCVRHLPSILAGKYMATKQQEQQPSQKQERDQMRALIGKNVLQTLGQPANFLRLQVQTLWGDRFRVNVLVGSDMASAKIVDSFFVLVDAEGNILSSTPKIAKMY
jgi:hypothetical protein